MLKNNFLSFFLFSLLVVTGLNSNQVEAKTITLRDLPNPFTFFRPIEGDSFTMGRRGLKQTRVTLSSFSIMAREVTQLQWFLIMKSNPSEHNGSEDCPNHLTWHYQSSAYSELCPDLPVTNVSWNDVQRFIKKLNQTNGLTGCKGTPRDPIGCYRLPTYAEWEYAARAGTSTAHSFGGENVDILLGHYAWYRDNSGGVPHPVGKKRPNPWGLYDMHGNVEEWVQDNYTRNPPGGTDPLFRDNPRLKGLMARHCGGSWWNSANGVTSFSCNAMGLTDKSSKHGFRLVQQTQ